MMVLDQGLVEWTQPVLKRRHHRKTLTQGYIESLSGINLYDVRTFEGYDFIDQVR